MLNIKNTTDGYLKDVEIKGNTVQNAEDLADMRSVGDKVEGQELYEIPVVSCGKNLFDGLWESGIIDQNTGSLNPDSNVIRSLNYIKVLPNTNYIASSNILTKGVVWHSYDENYKFIEGVANKGLTYYTTPSNAKYIKVRTFLNDNNVISLTCPLQIEESNVATPYEPYQEDKLTILSPVQLEKVGDVRDRIICKDGVWGVEKNIDTVMLDGSDGFGYYLASSQPVDTALINIYVSKALPKASSSSSIISNRFTNNSETEVGNCYRGGSNNVHFILSKAIIGNVTMFKSWLQENPTTLMYELAQPQFIPLPHDQQVKLRTFAGQTNIHFETEIEPTLKAQVPKSIGATVNTHTEQIGNLSKELDRVKKLEESTVSTVVTESNFTTVEETANGYFEDVQLEGKTLVNLCIKRGGSLTPDGAWHRIGTVDNSILKPNTVYTIIPSVVGITYNIQYTPISTSSDISIKGFNGIVTFTYPNDGRGNLKVYLTGNQITTEINPFITILEGDHTQNPPSYFEGLLSAGQDVEEVSVESVNNGNLANDVTYGSYYYNSPWGNKNNSVSKAESNNARTSSKIKVFPNATYFYNAIGGNRCVINFFKNKSDNLPYNGVKLNDSNIPTGTFNTDSECNYIEVYAGTGVEISNLFINLGDKQIDKEYLSNKKPLVYYNNETQTWEKPVLRQWDSIEKHSDGKYYYHKRSGEVVLNGSENWELGGFHNEVTRTFDCKSIPTLKGNDSLVCIKNDKFPSMERANVSTNTTFEYMSIAGAQHPFVNIQLSKLSSQDVTGFTTWLQANPTTVVYQLAQEEVYECTNIDLITYADETNYIVNSGAISPKSILKVHSNISNVVKILQEKVSLLENNVKVSQEVQDMMILESDMRILDMELALMEYMPITLNLGGDIMFRSATYFNFLKNHIENETYEKEYLENVMNKYLATNRLTQEEYDELYKLLYPPVYDIELPIEY